MANLSDLLPDGDALFSIARRGDIVLVDAGKIQGFRRRQTGEEQRKFVVVLGEDDVSVAYGVLLINSSDYSSLGDETRKHSYPISPRDYSFLSHASYVYCGDILRIEKAKFAEGRIKSVASVNAEDMELIIATIADSSIVSTKDKKRFGII